ncbi:ribonuclease pancreatic-like [Gouania willdenowi]|uniref:ribonuclease pancreatic-like n=1 Tax=Gouania willdenowi TaxID=441366 RepID=UPI0010564AFC|nr:ribonuclease pancreatic-like [Gouania willdenowi]
MKIPVVCLMLMLLAACALCDVDIHPHDQWLSFQKKHIKKDMEIKRCDAEIKKRSIFEMKEKVKVCKPVNTFILSEASNVSSVCESGEKCGEDGNLIKSKTRFDIVVCRLNKNCKYPECKYTGRKLTKKIIIIDCKGGYPVHYNGNNYYCNN